MKGTIIYKGKYGATHQYAEWLGGELQLPVLDIEQVTAEDLRQYDYLLVGSSVYIGKLLIRDWLQQHSDILQHKKVYLFIVCATPPKEKDKLAIIERDNIPGPMRDQSVVFFLQGRMIQKKLKWLDRLMLNIGARLQQDPAAKKSMLHDFDAVKKENITGILTAIKAFNQEKKEAVTQLQGL